MTPRLVSLPMYEAPADADRAFRRALAAQLTARGFDPRFAEPDDLVGHWRSPDLLLSQTCGYPLVSLLKETVRLVATPVYDAPGCEGPFYRSAVVVREDHGSGELESLRGGVAAFNAFHSQSGFNAFRALLAPLARGERFFRARVETGSHRGSIEAVLRGEADVAAIDALTLALRLDRDPGLPLRVLVYTPPAPSLPFITSATRDMAREDVLFDSLTGALAETQRAGLASALRLRGFERLPRSAYDVILRQEGEARGLGYADLA